MPSLAQFAGQALVFAAVAAATGYLAANPTYRHTPEGMAQIKLSFAHGGRREVECRRLTPQEIAKLPPRERRPNTCERQRLAMQVELDIDGQMIYAERLEPGGLWGDGPARTYRKFLVNPGPHTITARLRDSKREEGFDYEDTRTVTLAPEQNLAIDFKADAGGFQFR